MLGPSPGLLPSRKWRVSCFTKAQRWAVLASINAVAVQYRPRPESTTKTTASADPRRSKHMIASLGTIGP
jgi:hypothetical protein